MKLKKKQRKKNKIIVCVCLKFHGFNDDDDDVLVVDAGGFSGELCLELDFDDDDVAAAAAVVSCDNGFKFGFTIVIGVEGSKPIDSPIVTLAFSNVDDNFS